MLKINPVQNISFQRRLTKEEKRELEPVINSSLKLLDKEVDLIVHNSAAPSKKGENTGIGTLASKNIETNFSPFVRLYGINSIQVEPDGLRQDPSPYSSRTFAKNEFMIPLKRLTTPEYDNILPKRIFDDVVANRPKKTGNRVDFDYVSKTYNYALSEAYANFKLKQPQGLVEDFEKFKKDKEALLEKDMLYSFLAEKYKDDDSDNWPELDSNLFSPKKGSEELAKLRIQRLHEEFKDEKEFFLFKQMLVSKARKNIPMKTIGDAAIAFAAPDVWGNKDLFMKDYKLGCPPDFFSKDGQAWGFAVLDPNKLFNEDGSLGDSGKLLYSKYKTLFEDNPGGVRIDHIIGLVDPFVYKDKPSSETAGRLYTSPDNAALAKFHKKTVEQYASIIQKIVIPAAKSVGLDSDAIICEDLGDENIPTNKVMEYLKLRGIVMTEFTDPSRPDCKYRGKNATQEKIIMAGSHDNDTLIHWVDDVFKDKEKLEQHANVLSEDLSPVDATENEVEAYKEELMTDRAKFRTAILAELFTSPAKKIQVFFADFFGMRARYNTPGTEPEENWGLRIPASFEKSYHKKLEENKGFNVPEVLEIAIRQKGADFVLQNQELVDALVKYKNILKEKE